MDREQLTPADTTFRLDEEGKLVYRLLTISFDFGAGTPIGHTV